MSTGYVGILSFELHFPGSRSLKEKRMLLSRIKGRQSEKNRILLALSISIILVRSLLPPTSMTGAFTCSAISVAYCWK